MTLSEPRDAPYDVWPKRRQPSPQLGQAGEPMPARSWGEGSLPRTDVGPSRRVAAFCRKIVALGEMVASLGPAVVSRKIAALGGVVPRRRGPSPLAPSRKGGNWGVAPPVPSGLGGAGCQGGQRSCVQGDGGVTIGGGLGGEVGLPRRRGLRLRLCRGCWLGCRRGRGLWGQRLMHQVDGAMLGAGGTVSGFAVRFQLLTGGLHAKQHSERTCAWRIMLLAWARHFMAPDGDVSGSWAMRRHSFHCSEAAT